MPYTPAELGVRAMDTRPYGALAAEEQDARERAAAASTTAAARPRMSPRNRQLQEGGDMTPGYMTTPPRQDATAGPPRPQPGTPPRAVGPPPDQPTPTAPKVGDYAPSPPGITARYAGGPPPDIGALHYLGDVAKFAGGQQSEVGKGVREALAGDVGPGILHAAGAQLSILGVPWMYAGSEVAQTGIEANPMMRERFHELLRAKGIDPADNTTSPTERAAIADETIKEFENVAYRAAYDPSLPPDVRVAASVMSALLKAEQFAILGGPQGLRSLANLSRAFVRGKLAGVGYDPAKDVFAGPGETPALRERPGVKVPLDQEQAAAQGGGVTAKQAGVAASTIEAAQSRLTESLRNAVDSGDPGRINEVTQRARAAGYKEPEIAAAQAEADRLHAAGVQTQIVSAAGESGAAADIASPTLRSLGPILARAIKTQDRRIQDLVRRGGTRGLSLAEMDDVIASLEAAATKSGRTVPLAVMNPLRRMRTLLYDETTLEELRRSTAKQELATVRTDVKAAGAEARAAQAKAEATGRAAEKGARKVGEQVADAEGDRSGVLVEQMAQLSAERQRVTRSIAANRATVHIAGDTEPHSTGYMAPDDAQVWADARLHSGKYDSPSVRSAFVDFVRQHADQIEGALRHVTHDDLITRLAQATNADRGALMRSLPKTAEVSRRLYVADQVLTNMVREWRQLGLDVRDGRATAEALDTKTAEVAEFMRAVTEGHSEAGRALGSLRIVRRAAAAEVVRGSENVRRTERTLIAAQENLERLGVEFERARAGEIITPEAQAAIAKLGARMDAAVERAAAARAEHEAAVKIAADAAAKLHRSLLEQAVKLNVSKEKLAALAVLDPEDIQGVIHYFRDIAPMKKGEAIGGWLLNNTYGSIPNLMNNTINTGLHVLYQNMVIRPAGELVTRHVARAIVGADVIVKGETKAAWLAMHTAIPDAFRLYGKVQIMGEAPELQLKYGLEHLIVEEAEKLGSGRRPITPGPKGLLIEPILRNLSASDGFWRVLDGAGEARARLLRDVYVARKGGDDAAVEELTKFLTNPDPARLAEANEHSLRATFNDPVEVGSNTGKLLQALSIGTVDGFAPLRILIPAARFGISAAKHSVALSGGGLISGSVRMARARGMVASDPARIALARRGAQEFTEGAIGAVMLVVANHMFDSGLITGAFPTKTKEQEQWRLEGRQEMSILIAGHWVPQSFLGPLSAPFVLTALMRNQLDTTSDATLADRVERGAMGIGRYLMDVPAFSGTYRLLDLIYSGTKYGASAAWEKFASLQISKLIPDSATLRSLVGVWDPLERDPEGIIERLAARFPVTSSSVRAALDPQGQPKQRPVSGLGSLTPTQATEPKSLGGLDQEFAQDGSVLMPVGNSIGNQKLTRDEFYRYQQDAGARTTIAVQKVVDSLRYKREADPTVRQHLRQQAIDAARAESRRVVSREFLNSAKGDAAVARAAIMYRSSSDDAAFRTALRTLIADGRLTKAVKDQIDATRGFNADGSHKPTVDELIRGTIRAG